MYDLPSDLPKKSDFPAPKIKRGETPSLKKLVQLFKHLGARRFFALTVREQKQMWEEMGLDALFHVDHLTQDPGAFDAIAECDETFLTIGDITWRSKVNDWGDCDGIDLVRVNPRYSGLQAICDLKELKRISEEEGPAEMDTAIYQTRSGRYKWSLKRDGRVVARSSRSFEKRSDAVDDLP